LNYLLVISFNFLLVFMLGKFGIGLFLTMSNTGSAYGAAGSLIIILVWVFYSAQILFFGAAFTRVYAVRYGSHRADKEGV
jgi:membrane protein